MKSPAGVMGQWWWVLTVVAAVVEGQTGRRSPYYSLRNEGCGSHIPRACQTADLPSRFIDGCLIRNIDAPKKNTECSLPDDIEYYPARDLPFRFAIYYLESDKDNRPVVVMSFPNITTTSVKFRFQDMGLPDSQDNCLEMTLGEVPSHDVIVYDCPFFSHIKNHTIQLSVQDGEGRGGLYTFNVPDGATIEPTKTNLSEWQVVQYLDLGHITRSQGVPVTIQMAPFANLTYNVSLWSCTDQDNCTSLSLAQNFTLRGPESVDFPEEETPQATRVFLLPEPGTYLVTAQITHPTCPPQGCFISRSPKFVVPRDMVHVKVLVVTAGILIIAISLRLAYGHLQRVRRAIYNDLKDDKTKRPTVLLIYLAESWSHLEVVTKLTVYLKDTCFTNPLLVDIHSTRQNPNSWTAAHIGTAKRVVFVVPETVLAQSVTPNKQHWNSAIRYMRDFVLNRDISHFATVLLPFSGPVPHEIGNLKRFKLLHNLTNFVIWLHGGTRLDRWIFWRSQLQSEGSDEATLSLTDLRCLFESSKSLDHKNNDFRKEWRTYHENLSGTGSHDGQDTRSKGSRTLTQVVVENPAGVDGVEKLVSVGGVEKLTNVGGVEKLESVDGVEKLPSVGGVESTPYPGAEFDPDIADADELLGCQQEDGLDGYETSSCEGSILGDEAFLS